MTWTRQQQARYDAQMAEYDALQAKQRPDPDDEPVTQVNRTVFTRLDAHGNPTGETMEFPGTFNAPHDWRQFRMNMQATVTRASDAMDALTRSISGLNGRITNSAGTHSERGQVT